MASLSRVTQLSKMGEVNKVTGTTVILGVQTLVEVRNVDLTPRLFSKDK